jgi:hypothetical protein
MTMMPKDQAAFGLGQIVSRMMDHFLVSTTSVYSQVTMSALRAQGLVVLRSKLERPYANIIANKASDAPPFLNDDGDEEEDGVPMTVDDKQKT